MSSLYNSMETGAVNAEPSETAPLHQDKASTRRTAVGFGVVLACAALAGFAVGTATTGVRAPSTFDVVDATHHVHYELVPVAPANCPAPHEYDVMPKCDSKEVTEGALCKPTKKEKKKIQKQCDLGGTGKLVAVYRKVSKETCLDDPSWNPTDEWCQGIEQSEWLYPIAKDYSREALCALSDGKSFGWQSCRRGCDSCGVEESGIPGLSEGCSLEDSLWVADAGEAAAGHSCSWIEQQISSGKKTPFEICGSKGTSLGEDVDAYRACGRACGTCKAAR